jgi:hydroxymethylglutaryl-CoA reductase
LLPPSKSANYWSTRGGFKATVINTEKIGQVHFLYKGDVSKLELFFVQKKFFSDTESITKKKEVRNSDIVFDLTFFPLLPKIAWG